MQKVPVDNSSNIRCIEPWKILGNRVLMSYRVLMPGWPFSSASKVMADSNLPVLSSLKDVRSQFVFPSDVSCIQHPKIVIIGVLSKFVFPKLWQSLSSASKLMADSSLTVLSSLRSLSKSSPSLSMLTFLPLIRWPQVHNSSDIRCIRHKKISWASKLMADSSLSVPVISKIFIQIFSSHLTTLTFLPLIRWSGHPSQARQKYTQPPLYLWISGFWFRRAA